MTCNSSRWRFLSILLLIAAVAPSGCTGDGLGEPGEDEESVSSTDEAIIGGTSVSAQYPEATIIVGTGGSVPSGYGSYCSATVIAPKVVLTAGHCVDGPTAWRVGVGAQLRTTTRAATFDWKNEGDNNNPNHHDIGLLFLDQPITLASYPTIAQAAAPSNSQVLNVGRVLNGTRTDTLWGAVTSNLLDGASYGYPYDYIANDLIESGDSGGPDFLYGTHKIIAVNSGTGMANGSQIEGLARVDLLYSWITRPLDDSGFFIRQTYLDVLEREPDSSGFSYYMNLLQACNGASACLTSTRVSIARGMLESPENRTQNPELNPASPNYNSAFVTNCYTNFLRRQPDTQGYNYYMSFLSSTGDYSAVVSGFINSTEYRQRFNSL